MSTGKRDVFTPKPLDKKVKNKAPRSALEGEIIKFII